MQIINDGITCPLSEYLQIAFAEEIIKIRDAYAVGPSIALCNYLCPAVLGFYESTENKACAIRKRLLNEDKFADIAIAEESSTWEQEPWRQE